LMRELEFIIPSGKSVRVSISTVSHFITTGLSNMYHWRYCDFISVDDVTQYLSGNVSSIKTLRTIAYYILFFAENLTFSVYVNIKGNLGEEAAENYKRHMTTLLTKLRRMHAKIKSCSDIEEGKRIVDGMLEECLKNAIDPF